MLLSADELCDLPAEEFRARVLIAARRVHELDKREVFSQDQVLHYITERWTDRDDELVPAAVAELKEAGNA